MQIVSIVLGEGGSIGSSANFSEGLIGFLFCYVFFYLNVIKGLPIFSKLIDSLFSIVTFSEIGY
jgi:hypothetical protein